MDRLRKLWPREPTYEPLIDGSTTNEQEDAVDVDSAREAAPRFSTIEYTICVLLGVSMLWAWNMFLAAGPYFQRRFQHDEWILANFQSAEVSVSTVTSLGAMLVLTKLQKNASYPKRIMVALVMNLVAFVLLAMSTRLFLGVSEKAYFAFLIIMIVVSSSATGLCQNGIFAFISGFRQPAYTQGVMTGQGIAGVLPCIVQITSVLAVRGDPHQHRRSDSEDASPPSPVIPAVRSSAAFAYFLTATGVSAVTLLAFFVLLDRHRKFASLDRRPASAEDEPRRKSIPFAVLASKLRWLAGAVFLTFAITMIFPVFTQLIVSVRPSNEQPALLQPPAFIPLAFLLWNLGDLLGRLATAIPSLSLVQRPRVLFLLSLSRIIFIGLYHLCNIRGEGAIVSSDVFYLVVVQASFGFTNGYFGSTCMIGAGSWVDAEEQEAAGGFMSLCLVAGLAVGSLASFFVTGI